MSDVPKEHSDSKIYKGAVILGGFACLGAISYLTVKVAGWVRQMVVEGLDNW